RQSRTADAAGKERALARVDVVNRRLVERAARGVEVDVAAHAAELPHRPVECHRLGPRGRVAVPHRAPFRVGVEGASDARRAGDGMVGVLSAEPRDAIAPVPRRPEVKDQRIAERNPIVAALPHAADLIRGNANPLLHVHPPRGGLPRDQASEPTELPADGLELVLTRTLAPDTAL